MSKLFLTSYLAGTKNLVKEFLKDVPEKEITFVPTASNTEDYKGYVDEAKQAFLEFGFSINILDISKTEKQKIENILKDTKILYVSGGNTFYLLQELKRKKILDTIKNKISNGMLYIGESAGAIIASKNIEYNQTMKFYNFSQNLLPFSSFLFSHIFIYHHFLQQNLFHLQKLPHYCLLEANLIYFYKFL